MWHLEEIVRRNKVIADKYFEELERQKETETPSERESETEGEMKPRKLLKVA